MHRKNVWAAVAAVWLLLPAGPAAAQRPLEADGAASLGVALRRLGTTKRVLMIGAHPDDENTAVLAELALGDGADVAYLSLTRGEGGQNLIGPELQEALGLIRTEELLAARRLDGAQQFFTRAYDYGYSKSAAEAFSQWPQDSLLSDVVEIVRRYRPDIIIAVFSGTPGDGHGQHQASGVMARAAFAAAADPARFPQQVARGLQPHRARYLFQALYRPPANPPLRLITGDLDPLFGRSRYQIAMQSRSRHRSQDMGRAEPLGPQTSALTVLAGDYPAGATSLFAGVDTTLAQRARAYGADNRIVMLLAGYDSAATALRAAYNPLRRAALVPQLIDALRRLDLALAPRPADIELTRVLLDERAQLADALRLDAGVVVDVVADTPTPVPGATFDVVVTVWNGGPHVVGVRPPELLRPSGWQAVDAQNSGDGVTQLPPNGVLRRTYHVTVAADARRTEPYFLRAPRRGAMYSWTDVESVWRGEPFEPPRVRAAVELIIGGLVRIEREAEFVAVDKALGEVRRPLLVVSAVSVTVEPRIAVIPEGDVAPRMVTVTVRAARDSLVGSLRLDVPDGWQVTPATVPLQVARAGESHSVQFTVTPTRDARAGIVLRALFTADGRTYGDGHTILDYPHIRPHALYSDAVVRVSRFPVAVAGNLRIGYIEGAGDDGAIALRQLGATVEQLDASALAAADLSQYDAIVAGIRAYEVRPDLLAHNNRLLDYVRNGGTFVVQYNKHEIVEGGFMPYRATIARPHGRVTDERAGVTLLEPQHALLSWPNRIAASDFAGWVHERGLYFLDTFDPQYTPLLAMADPGEEAQRGALVVARVGRGWYVYTGLALFRQLPEGVPGAYRLLANFVSLGKAPGAL